MGGQLSAQDGDLARTRARSTCRVSCVRFGDLPRFGSVRLTGLELLPVTMFCLVVSRVVQHAAGSAIGVINAARIGAGFIGPVAATRLLAWTSPAVVYLLLASIGLACVPCLRIREPGART